MSKGQISFLKPLIYKFVGCKLFSSAKSATSKIENYLELGRYLIQEVIYRPTVPSQ